jgi:glycosyltransferase involved in cell wall biosynthesis
VKTVVVIGQTPPPHGGQTIMMERLLAGAYQHAKLHHVSAVFSRDMTEMGRVRLRKLFEPASVVARAMYARFRHGARVLYYAPSGPAYLPMLRDFAILIPLRWMFDKTIFHFHAAGTSELYARLPRALRVFYRWSYFRADVAIQLSEHNPDDPGALGARHTVTIPNGIVDEYAAIGRPAKPKQQRARLLYVGLINKSKGFLVLLDAVRNLRSKGVDVDLHVVGRFASAAFEAEVMQRISADELRDAVTFHGVLTGRAKYDQYLAADIFCFPTFFESESFGLVVIEAMQFATAVVATKWRGVQSLVRDGETGYLVPPRDSDALTARLLELIQDPALRVRMGERGREVFVAEYVAERFEQRMDACFALVSE